MQPWNDCNGTVAALCTVPMYSIVVTSQLYGSDDGSFKGTVSEFGLCAFPCGLSVLILSQYLYNTSVINLAVGHGKNLEGTQNGHNLKYSLPKYI